MQNKIKLLAPAGKQRDAAPGIELLAPAGNMDKLQVALLYGADAVYVGGKDFGLRAKAGNFTDSELKQATDFVHANGKKIYVTVNIFARNSDFEPLKKYLKFLESIKVDAIIVSDLGALRLARETTNLEVHISTQANVLNKYTAQTYAELGASRIILARECSLTEIREIAEHLKGKAEIEVFVHGAMCVSYSGRCLLSSYMTSAAQENAKLPGAGFSPARDSNRGACIQACRFNYSLVEEKRPNEHFQIEEDQRGSYILNSRDLCLADYIQDLAAAGVVSFKIEGRNKSEYYVAGAVNTYRKLIDNLGDKKFDYKSELDKIPHRPYTIGFLHNMPEQFYPSANPHGSHEFVGICIGDNQIEQRNVFCVGDTLEILSPDKDTFNKTFSVTKITNKDGKDIQRANHVQEILRLDCPYQLRRGDILRRKN